jgi:hypothetical protein
LKILLATSLKPANKPLKPRKKTVIRTMDFADSMALLLRFYKMSLEAMLV